MNPTGFAPAAGRAALAADLRVGPTLTASMTRTVTAAAALVVLTGSVSACRDRRHDLEAEDNPTPSLTATKSYPAPIDPSRVSTYPALTKSGAGYFYDEVLEYRVWVHHAEGGDDSFKGLRNL